MLPTVSAHQMSPDVWAQRQFQGVRLGHCARRKRLISFARALAQQPGKSIPELLASPYDIEATYDLFKRPEVTPDAIQAGHRRLVRTEMHNPGRYLLFEDTTYVSFTNQRTIEGLGPIGRLGKGQQGYLLHSILAVAHRAVQPNATGHRPALEVVGLADQQSLVRVPRPEEEASDDSTQRLYRERESRRWIDSGRRFGRAPRPTRRSAGYASPIAKPTSMNI